MRVSTFTLLSILYLHISPSVQDYLRNDNPLNTNAYADYSTAVGSDLLDTAFNKKVTLETGSTCQVGRTEMVIAAGFPDGDKIDASGSYLFTINSKCAEVCSNTTQTLSEITANSRQKLENGQNVAVNNTISNTTTYLLTVSVASVAEGEADFLTAEIKLAGGANENILLKVNASQDGQRCDLMIKSQTMEVLTSLAVGEVNQIAIMSSNVNRSSGVAFLVNSTVIHSVAKAQVTSLTLAPASSVFNYVIEEWKVFAQLLTSRDLYEMVHSLGIPAHSATDCVCPSNSPIFKRWPGNRGEPWLGTSCNSVGGDSNVSRVDVESRLPQFITDGDYETFWMSDTEALSKLTIDLDADYQIFYAEISLLVVPKYLVLTKSSSPGGTEDVLFVITDDCSAPLPAGLPAETPLKCQTLTLVHQSEAHIDVSVIQLDWTQDILYPNFVTADMAAFNQSLEDGLFEANTISLYQYEFAGDAYSARKHIISEVNLYGSCGCRNGGECQPNPRTVSRRRRAAQIPQTSFATRVRQGFTFEEISGYTCLCPTGFAGSTCQSCDGSSYAYDTGSGCQECGCAAGALDGSCNSDGKCKCNPSGAGISPELADDKCTPFVHSVEPNFGPVAGGTSIVVRGAWLDQVEYIYIGEQEKCYRNGSSNSTLVYCETPAVSTTGEVNITTENTIPIATFDYRADPNITVIGRVDVFASGGVDIPVSGTNLDSIADPKIIVTVICKSSGEIVAALEGDCNVESSEEMNCKSPDLYTSIESDDVRCAPPSDEEAPSEEGTRKKRATSSQDPNTLYDFNIGFKLDGVTEFEDAAESPWLEENAQLLVRPNPKIHQFEDEKEIRVLDEAAIEPFLTIKGENLIPGTVESDYLITIGVGVCNLTVLYHDKFKCSLPAVLPDASEVDYEIHPSKPDEKLPAVIVNVGSLVQHVGYVMRKEKDNSNVLAIALSVAAVLIIIIIIAVIFIVRKMRRNRPMRKNRGSVERGGSRYVRGPHAHRPASRLIDNEHMDALKKWLIPKETLEIGTGLGQGQFGKVFLGSLTVKSGGVKKVAVKTIKADLLRTEPKAISNFLQEALLMKDFEHPNVLSLIGVVVNDEEIPMVVTPYMAKGDLKHVLRDETEDFTVGDLIHFGLQAATGMDYLASRKFIHRDLAARNCMVNEQYLLKIADFGMSHDIYAEDYYRVQDRTKPLPVKWMAIESLTTGKYTVQSDVWSYGVLLWEIMTRGATPYPGVNNYEIKEHLRFGRRLSHPEFCPHEMYDLMCFCWQMDPSERPAFYDLCETLRAFTTANSEYHREQTKEICDDYYSEPCNQDDVAIYISDGPGYIPPADYDCAIPVTPAPTSPNSAKDFNSNNSNSNGTQPSTSDDYLKPTPSKKNWLQQRQPLTNERYSKPPGLTSDPGRYYKAGSQYQPPVDNNKNGVLRKEELPAGDNSLTAKFEKGSEKVVLKDAGKKKKPVAGKRPSKERTPQAAVNQYVTVIH